MLCLSLKSNNQFTLLSLITRSASAERLHHEQEKHLTSPHRISFGLVIASFLKYHRFISSINIRVNATFLLPTEVRGSNEVEQPVGKHPHAGTEQHYFTRNGLLLDRCQRSLQRRLVGFDRMVGFHQRLSKEYPCSFSPLTI